MDSRALKQVSPYRPGLGAGMHVMLVGLQTKPELNGAMGVIETAVSTERISVRFENGRRLALKATNLQFVRPFKPFNPSIIAAIEDGQYKVVESWLASGGHANELFSTACGGMLATFFASYLGASPLMIACGSGSSSKAGPALMEPIVKLLLDHGAMPDKTAADAMSITALIAACQTRGNVKIVELLLKYGASVNKMGTEGQTALLYAARNGDAPTMILLLRAGADVALADKEIGESLELLNYKIELPVGALKLLEQFPQKRALYDAAARFEQSRRASIQQLGPDGAWLARAVRNERLIDTNGARRGDEVDGWESWSKFIARESLMPGMSNAWSPPGPPRYPTKYVEQMVLAGELEDASSFPSPPPFKALWDPRIMPKELRARQTGHLSRAMLLYQACWTQLGSSLFTRTDRITVHELGWAYEVPGTFDEADVRHRYADYAATLRRLFPLLEGFHLHGFGPEAPRHEASFLDGWFRFSLTPGLYEVIPGDRPGIVTSIGTATLEVPTITIAAMPAIWDGIWPDEGGTVKFDGEAVEPIKLERAAKATLFEHVSRTSEFDSKGDRTVPFAALWRPTFEALRDARRPVLITNACVVEEQLALQNLRALLGPNPSLLLATPNAFPTHCGLGGKTVMKAATHMSDLHECIPTALTIDIRKFEFSKFVDDPTWFLDDANIQTGLVSIGWSERLLWFQA